MDESKRTSEYGEDKRKRGPGLKGFGLLLGLVAFCLVSLSLAYLAVRSGPVWSSFTAAPKYTLHYDANAGDDSANVGNMPATEEEYSRSFAVSSKIPTREGYKFLGWADTAEPVDPATELAPVYAFEGLDVNGNATLQSSVSVTDADNYSKTIYAVWQKAKYTLLFDANGGSGEPAEQEAEATGDSYIFTIPDVIPQHANTNKVFLGWATSESATAAAYAFEGKDHDGNVTLQSTVEVTAAMTDRSLTLYAVWATRYTLSFDANSALGGSGNVPDSQTALVVANSHTFVIPAQMTANTPSRGAVGDYEFGWWGPDPENYNDTGLYYESEYMLTVEEPVQKLYAFYRPLRDAKLVLYRNYDGSDTTVVVPYTISGSSLLPQVQITQTNLSRKNYNFLGWAETPDATVAQYQRGDYVTINRVKENDKTLYAVWQPLHRFSVNFVNRPNWPVPCNVYRLVNGQWKTDWLNGNTGVTAANGSRYQSNWRFYNGKNWDNSLTHDSSYTWDQAFWQQNGLYATYASNKIADYEFLGWSYSPDKTSEADVDVHVDENGVISEAITASCLDGNNCVGGTEHQVVLFPVWRTTPRHYYRLIFAANDYNVDAVVDRSTGAASAHPTLDHNNNNGGNILYSILSNSQTDKSYKKYIVCSDYMLVSDGVNSYTWYKDDLNDPDGSGPLAQRNSTDTAQYELAGWSFTKWGQVDVPVDDDGNLPGNITIAHSDAYEQNTAVTDDDGNLTVYVVQQHPENAEGAGHTLILYPVWKSVPLHRFQVIFGMNDENQTLHWYNAETDSWSEHPARSGLGTRVYDIYNVVYGGRWLDRSNKYYVPIINSPVLSADKGVPEEWDEDYWKAIGCYVTKSDSATLRYVFAGWAYKPGPNNKYDQVDIDVDKNGFLTAAPSFEDLNDTCHEKNSGSVHTILLTPIWRTEPLNSYRLVFHGNGGGVQYYKDNGALETNWRYGFEIINNPRVYPDGRTTNLYGQYKPANYWRSPTIPLTDDNGVANEEARSYTWSKDFLRQRAQTAVRNDTETHRYRFLGWSYNTEGKNTSALTAEDVDIPVDENGLITKDITITDPWNKTDQGNHFVAFLYAVWESEEIHSFQLRFKRNTSIHYWSNNIDYWSDYYGYWRSSDNGIPVTYTTPHLSRDQDSYTWGTDFWDAHGLYAWRSSEEFYDIRFLGWAYTPNATTPDIPVEWRVENGKTRGYIAQAIRFDDPGGDSCAGGVHILDLYAVYERIPKTRTFTLSFDANGGSGAPDGSSQTETYNGTGWADTGPSFDIPTQKPSWGSRFFVGWSEVRNDGAGTYGYEDDSNARIKAATENLQDSISFPYGSNGLKTLYAVWWNSYRLKYDGNGNGDAVNGLTSGEIEYLSVNNGNSWPFTVNAPDPTRTGYVFKGWATSANATTAQYAHGDQVSVTANNDGYGEITLYAVWEAESSGSGQSSDDALLQSAAPLWDDYASAPENDPDLPDWDEQDAEE